MAFAAARARAKRQQEKKKLIQRSTMMTDHTLDKYVVTVDIG
jgi:hypothetical protein